MSDGNSEEQQDPEEGPVLAESFSEDTGEAGGQEDPAPSLKKQRTNKAEQEKLFHAYRAGRAQAFQTYLRDFNVVKEWALVLDMTWLHNVLLFLEDIQVLEEQNKKKEDIPFYEKAHDTITEMKTNFADFKVSTKAPVDKTRTVFRPGVETRQGNYAKARFSFWKHPKIQSNMKLGKQLLDLFFNSRWSLFVDQADISIISFLDPSCSILKEGLIPHWTMYIADKFLRTFFVQLLNYHRLVSLGSKVQKVAYLRLYTSELEAYRSRIEERFMMRMVKGYTKTFSPDSGGITVENLSSHLTLWIMYRENLPFGGGGAARSERLKFDETVQKLFSRDVKSAQEVEITDNVRYIQEAWKVGIPTRFVTNSFHPMELSCVLEYMYGKDRFRMWQWETFIRWKTSDGSKTKQDFDPDSASSETDESSYPDDGESVFSNAPG